MVTGVKPDEQVDWAEVQEFSRIVTPMVDALDRLSLRLFGCVGEEIPDWVVS